MTTTDPLSNLCGEQPLCAAYSVYVRNRLTGQPLEGCDFTNQPAVGKYTRKLNGTDDPVASTAEVRLNTGGLDPGCCECFPVPWRDELVIERLDRAGRSEGIAWVGPIWNVIDDSVFGELLIKAKDRSAWVWEEQDFITEEIKLTDVDESEVWMAVWNHLEACGANSGLVPRPVPTGKVVSVEYPAFTLVQDILITLPHVFWSVEGDRMWGPGPTSLGFGEQPVAVLDVSSHWDEQGAVVDYNGRNTATCVLVRNQSTPTPVDLKAQELAAEDPNAQPRNALGQFVSPDAPPQPTLESEGPTTLEPVTGPLYQAQFPNPCKPHPEFGLHKHVIVDESIESQEEADRLAYETYVSDHDGDAFLVTSAGSLSSEAPTAVCDLLIGRAFNAVADTACVPIEATLRLNNLVVDFEAQETGSGVRLAESRVATDLQPLSNTRTSESRLSI